MIDWITFIDSLDTENFADVAAAVHNRRLNEAEEDAVDIVLTFDEIKIARENPMTAILKIKKRVGCEMLVARAAVDFLVTSDMEAAARSGDSVSRAHPDLDNF